MSVSFPGFLRQLAASPVLAAVVLLVLAVILVNGWTDAPNAIATAVVTKALPFRAAVALAAVCNLLGVTVMTAVNSSVAETIYDIADFGGGSAPALAALCAALAAIVFWSALAWRFGIPTSESHALVAGVSGAAVALQGGLGGVHGGAWAKVLLGLLLSLLLGFLGGRISIRLLRSAPGSPAFFRRGQAAGAAALAFLHGAQDGQKFMGIFLLGVALAQGRQDAETFLIPFWLMALCACAMALGTLMGGRRIIDKVGRDMVALTPRSGFAADLGGGACLLLCSLLGLPVSTTHAKTAAILGVGGRADRGVVRSILLTWLLTFPGCALLGFLAARLFLKLLI